MGDPASGMSQCAKFGLGHRTPELFVSCQYGLSLPWYACYRIGLALYVTLISIMDNIVRADQSPWVYFTTWSYTLQTFAMLVKAVNVIHYGYTHEWYSPTMLTQEERKRLKMRWNYKLQWVLHNYTSCIPYLVTSAYWIFLWKISKEKEMRDPVYVHFTVQLHAINSVLALTDTLVGATPTRVQHFYQPMMCLIVYTLFSVAHKMITDSGPIYPFLNWGRVGASLGFVLAGCLVLWSFHVIVWYLKRLQRHHPCCGYLDADEWSRDGDEYYNMSDDQSGEDLEKKATDSKTPLLPTFESGTRDE